MAIKSRFAAGDVSALYHLPQPILHLFDEVIPIGEIIDRQTFFGKHLPYYEAQIVRSGDYRFSIRPAWMAYYNSPKTHVIVTGHILFCHVRQGETWYSQPSMRLFSQDVKDRIARFHELVGRAFRFSGGTNGFFPPTYRAA